MLIYRLKKGKIKKRLRLKPCTLQSGKIRSLMIDLFWKGDLSYPVQFESESREREFQFVLVWTYTIVMYSVSGLNILGWKFVVQSDSGTIQNNSREQLVFFLHFTGALFANEHYTATNDLYHNIDILSYWRVVFGKFIFPSSNSWNRHKLWYLLLIFCWMVFFVQ